MVLIVLRNRRRVARGEKRNGFLQEVPGKSLATFTGKPNATDSSAETVEPIIGQEPTYALDINGGRH